MERRLTAILAADVVGYAALMERDEAGTFERLRAGRKELFEPEIDKHHGRIFKLMGDGLLAEFASVVGAVECAVSLQRGLADRNAGLPEEERIHVRIGINLGEVIVDGSDCYGDGVNIAARLEQLADPGGIYVSAKVVQEVERKLAFAFEPMGHHRVKNLASPISAFRVVLDGSASARPWHEPMTVPSKPSVAVLPFANLSGGAEQEYFADGLVEDVITNLSKIPSLFVIARNSTFGYKGTAVDIRKVAQELGVRYVLEGSVRRAANRLRITGQLVEGSTATHVWADKFEGPVEDVFELQDRLTESIVGAIEPSIRRAEIERARSKRPDKLDAYDFYLQALPHAYANTPAGNDRALRLLEESLRLDPTYASAHAFAAWCREQRFLRGGFHPEDRAAALEHARVATGAGTDDPQALSIGAFVLGNIAHDYESAIVSLDRAIEANGNSALAYGFSALVNAFIERYERASDHALKALRLSPFDPLNYHPYLALAHVHLFTDRPAEAVGYARLAIQSNPGFTLLHAVLTVSQVESGDLDAARAAAGRLLEIAPAFTIDGFARMGVYHQRQMELLAAGMRKAGLPD
ncbi:adenylate/guanylate cyclase domain-containing protein [Mesorhizobium sp. 1B3]|uniref:adenylate/guanylate cyclase domain-containing protein n=1 Tax=Mesorhizobium sp. 1B3 TaxID=3243599 RepID=UPI003D950BF5